MEKDLAFIRLDETPQGDLLFEIDGHRDRLIELLLSGMLYSDQFALVVLAACKFYSDRKDRDLFEIMRSIKK